MQPNSAQLMRLKYSVCHGISSLSCVCVAFLLFHFIHSIIFVSPSHRHTITSAYAHTSVHSLFTSCFLFHLAHSILFYFLAIDVHLCTYEPHELSNELYIRILNKCATHLQRITLRTQKKEMKCFAHASLHVIMLCCWSR